MWCRVKYLTIFVQFFHVNNSIRNRTKIHHCALFLSPPESPPWAGLYHFGVGPSCLSLTELSHQAFTRLYDTLFLNDHSQRKGRPQLMLPTIVMLLSLQEGSIKANIFPSIQKSIGYYNIFVDQGFSRRKRRMQHKLLSTQLFVSKLEHLLLICSLTYSVT